MAPPSSSALATPLVAWSQPTRKISGMRIARRAPSLAMAGPKLLPAGTHEAAGPFQQRIRGAVLLRREHHGRRAALARTVKDGLDVVPVRVEHERGVVPGVVGPLAGSAVVLAAGSERGQMEGLHGLPIGRLKREMDAR